MQTTTTNIFISILKAAGLSLAFSFLAAVVFAGILRATALPDSVIYPVNQTLKVLSIAIGVLAFVRGEKGWLQGMAASLLFTAFSYLLFSAVGNDFSLSYLLFAELALTLIAGGLCGVIAVNVKSQT
ncbi:MAG: TIGR04086 family membrane protein [Clostridia bacterium]|nr:TIGR04086 family membrane protein [Clostridia bacterium]